ncbi:helix-turn-helix domain-containing protein [Xenorhabdus taiwanensis]|uniref:HTH cro/C1-type domain-containing protein n=1 Tax=Xenorhabdus taiwanensis TaxID=3085177 RepID=A0ABN7C6T9_9GAMM|nr:hypothetical protein TCT1_30470 [Xenorhabdus sp. TCT-1]
MNLIKKYRQMANLKQKDLAMLVGLTPSAISHYETGIRAPDIAVSRKLINALATQGIKCSLDQLFANETHAPDPQSATQEPPTKVSNE